MKLSTTLVLATLAVAAFAPQATDAAHGRPVMKRVSGVATHHAKLAVPDLSEDDVVDEPIGHTFGIDDNEEPTTPPVVAPTHGGYVDSSSGSGEGDDDHGSNDGSNEDSSSDSSGDGSNAAPTTSTESADTHGAHPLSLHEETDWELFDHQDSTDGSDGSGENAESSSSGSNEDTDGSGGSGSNEEQPPNESAETSDHHHNAHGPAVGGAAGLKLAASAAAGSARFSVSPEHLVKVAAGIGAAVGALVAAVGVVHLRRQQQRDEQSTLAEELPEPQTGREDFEPVSGADEDELASSSVDLEEALTQEQDDADDADDSDDESEGSFANDAVV